MPDEEARLELRGVEMWGDKTRMEDVVVRDVRLLHLEQTDRRHWEMRCQLSDHPEDRIEFTFAFNYKTREIEAHVTHYPRGNHIYEEEQR